MAHTGSYGRSLGQATTTISGIDSMSITGGNLTTSGTGASVINPYTFDSSPPLYGDPSAGRGTYAIALDTVVAGMNTILRCTSFDKRAEVRNNLITIVNKFSNEDNFHISHTLTGFITKFRGLTPFEGETITREHSKKNTKVIMMAKEMKLDVKYDVYAPDKLTEIVEAGDKLFKCIKLLGSENTGDHQIGVQLLLNLD